MAGPIRAFLDTNILYGNPTFDMFLSLAEPPYRLLEPCWNEYVFMELGGHLPQRLFDLARRYGERITMTQASLKARTRIAAMRRAFPEALTDTLPLERFPDSLTSDPADKAIAVGVISARADVLVTRNVKHFNRAEIRAYHHLVIQDDDDFLAERFHENPRLMRSALIDMCSRHRREPRNLRELVNMLKDTDRPSTLATLLEQDASLRYESACSRIFSPDGRQGRDHLGRFTSIARFDDGDLTDGSDYWGPDGNGPEWD